MTPCTQCAGPADMRISWLGKASMTENIPQECAICESCMRNLWAKYSTTQFGQTLAMRPLP